MLCRPDKAAPRVRGRLGGQGPAEVEPQCGSWHPRSPSGGPDGGGETTGGKAASGGGRGRRLSAAARTSHQARLELQAAGSGTKYETAERSGSEHGGRTGKRAETAESSGDELGGTDTADRPFPERGGKKTAERSGFEQKGSHTAGRSAAERGSRKLPNVRFFCPLLQGMKEKCLLVTGVQESSHYRQGPAEKGAV
ncbi:Hypothetical predicted protein [Pelobates cultripes]|uniref:Uncharacterized protein n=1 Tax=Pelobates cultripes TaxID=61616 RepID=A0AAD1WH75_PELCU|nr:Hypothetical predicted protein [Pelobates cultripes]